MAKKSVSQPTVVLSVIENFLDRLAGEESVDAGVHERLRKTLLEDGENSIEALKAALFTQEPLA